MQTKVLLFAWIILIKSNHVYEMYFLIYQMYFLTIIDALCPPNPREFDIA